MEQILQYLMSWDYSRSEAVREAREMVEYTRRNGNERYSKAYAIQMILNDLE